MNGSFTDSEFSIKVRSKGEKEYTKAYTEMLRIESRMSDNTFPAEMQISVTALRDFSGVIRIALNGSYESNEEVRFFLPGFMYGTNRGEAPLWVDSKTPCMRMKEEFPASRWWTVRSDRLSHPMALMYNHGRIRGFSASPYFVCFEGNREQWYPGVNGKFDRYTGFGCSLLSGEVWYTLGYENAPWMFIDSHKYTQAGSLTDDNCIHISSGETITVTLYCFDLESEDERGIQDALRWTYEKFHEYPRKCRSVSETVGDMAGAIYKDAWLPENHCYSGFVFDKGDHYEYRPLPSISWTNGLSAAVPMLYSAYRLDDENIRRQALDCIDHIVKTSLNE
ncbi:MAG: hypothetical protein K5888_11080, partial [Lachnospiraceae bacterium]|nr:hypothetical protein [Lachnospiraceae bacterium]